MALFKSALTTQTSGSVDGCTFSHNRGGRYMRARTIPTDPKTANQMDMRSVLSLVSGVWSGTLTQAQRDAWNVYASNVTVTNALGDQIQISGANMFMRGNIPRKQAGIGLGYALDAPVIFDKGNFTPVVVTATATNAISVAFTTSDPWVDEDDAALLVYVSKPVNPAINYYSGPYRSAGPILGDATTPPASPAALTSSYAFAAGQKLFFRVRATRDDGRLSTTQEGSIIAV